MTRRRVLSDDQMRAIRAAYKPGVRGAGYRELARRFGVAESTIRDALTGRTGYVTAVSAAPAASTKNGGHDHTTIRKDGRKICNIINFQE